MNRPTSDNEDDVIRGWVAEAGDPRVEPRLEHLEEVRGRLLEQLGHSRKAATARGIRIVRVLAAACILIGVVFAVIHLVTRPVNAWAQVAQALLEKPWIHVVRREANGTSSESWISPRFEIIAAKYDHGPAHRGAEYLDLKTGIKAQYLAEENTIYRLPEGEDLQKYHARGLDFFRQLLRGEVFKTSPVPDTEIVEQTSGEVVEQGKTWKECELTIQWREGRKSRVVMRLRADPKTGLPRTWDVESTEGTIRQTLDYPDTGPADILALGVPATAKRVDRVPGEDLTRILSGLKIGRNRFDDYCGYVWFESTVSANITRVWRKGHKWRVDHALPRATTRAAILEYDRVPLDVDLAWWKQREKDLIFEPQAICDGATIWYYRYKAKPLSPDQPYLSERESVDSQRVYGSPDNPMMPWPHLLPEQLGHPDVYVPTPDHEFLVDPRPADGPPETVRLHVRDVHSDDPNQPDFYRLWIDPKQNHLALQAMTSVFDPSGPHSKNGSPTKIAYVETKILTDLAQSPSGFWYPTRVVRKTSGNNKVQQVTRFLLDFQARIPDELFQPLK
jgi:hypothetical protein